MVKTPGDAPVQAPLAVTTGDPNGIGREIILKAWDQREQHNVPPFFVIDDPTPMTACAEQLNLPVPVAVIENPEDALHVFQNALPVLSARAPAVDNAVLASIRHGATLAWNGSASGLVTNPVRKAVFRENGQFHAGHTEYLAHYLGQLSGAEVKTPVMMLVCSQMKVIPVTRHVPLSAVPNLLTPALLTQTVQVAAHGLQVDFGIRQPQFAIAGLNPHAGEDGDIGDEEKNVIIPAMEQLRLEGFHVSGPFSADSLFHPGRRTIYDAALCMYHDQALIPVKTMDFDNSVNITLGLPIVRTSPDHGPAQDIAGRNLANPASLIAALRLAGVCARTRAASQSEGYP